MWTENDTVGIILAVVIEVKGYRRLLIVTSAKKGGNISATMKDRDMEIAYALSIGTAVDDVE